MSKKFGLLIGINYIGTDYELSGCINDIIMMRKYLLEKRGYLESNITVLRDDAKNFVNPTKLNIVNAIKSIISKANSTNATEIFIHYSGHGTSDKDRNKDEKDGYDELIVGKDLQLILDDDLRTILSSLNNNTICYFIMDCCHSASNLDLPYIYSYENNVTKLIENNSSTYKNLVNKNIICISGCKDNQTSEDAYNVYQVYNGPNKLFSVSKNNLNGGALTSSLLKIVNNNSASLINIFGQLVTNVLRDGYEQIPMMSISKDVNLLKNIKAFDKRAGELIELKRKSIKVNNLKNKKNNKMKKIKMPVNTKKPNKTTKVFKTVNKNIKKVKNH